MRNRGHDGMWDRLLTRSPIPEGATAEMPCDDEARAIAAAKIDPRAFAPLYSRYVDPVYSYCLRCLGDPETAADATQDVFARALRALPRYREQAFRPWLFTIAHNVIVDAHRARGGRPPDASLDFALWSEDPA